MANEISDCGLLDSRTRTGNDWNVLRLSTCDGPRRDGIPGAEVATMYVRTEKQACAAAYILTWNTRILTTVERGLVQFLVLSSTIPGNPRTRL